MAERKLGTCFPTRFHYPERCMVINEMNSYFIE